MDYYRYYSIQEFADNYKHGELSRRELPAAWMDATAWMDKYVKAA